ASPRFFTGYASTAFVKHQRQHGLEQLRPDHAVPRRAYPRRFMAERPPDQEGPPRVEDTHLLKPRHQGVGPGRVDALPDLLAYRLPHRLLLAKVDPHDADISAAPSPAFDVVSPLGCEARLQHVVDLRGNAVELLGHFRAADLDHAFDGTGKSPFQVPLDAVGKRAHTHGTSFATVLLLILDDGFLTLFDLSWSLYHELHRSAQEVRGPAPSNGFRLSGSSGPRRPPGPPRRLRC